MRSNQESVCVSIVIPAHNASDTISETLQSILAQTYSMWEAIIVDDGSTDQTAEVANEFAKQDSRIRVIRQVQGGEAAARNAGIPLTRYDWLLFLDADDWIAQNHLQRMTHELVSNPDLDAVICRSARVASDGTLVPEQYFPPPGDLFPILARRAAFNVHACVVRKSIVEKVGCFDTSLQRLPDWDLWQKIARTGAHFGITDAEPLAFYRMRPNSISLDAGILLRDGLTILRRGHAVDPRVKEPASKYAGGLPSENAYAEEIYFLCWCAGIVLSQGNDPVSFLDSVKTPTGLELYPDAIAECIFYSALLPICESPRIWQSLADKILMKVDDFLEALQSKTKIDHLADRSGVELRKMILRSSPTWKPVFDDIDKTHQSLEENRKRAEENSNHWEKIATEREKWRIHWKQISDESEMQRKKWYQLAEEREKWRIHWQGIAEEKEKEITGWQQIANDREKWLSHWQRNAEEKEKEITGWQQIANDREKWVSHWQRNAEEKEKEITGWQQIADDREKWRNHWQNIAEESGKAQTEWQNIAAEREKWLDHWQQKAKEFERERNEGQAVNRELELQLQQQEADIQKLKGVQALYNQLRKAFWVRIGVRLGFVKNQKDP